jgi:hypothetical protein
MGRDYWAQAQANAGRSGGVLADQVPMGEGVLQLFRFQPDQTTRNHRRCCREDTWPASLPTLSENRQTARPRPPTLDDGTAFISVSLRKRGGPRQ